MNEPRTVRGPKASDIQNALTFLAAIGGGDESVRRTLTELKQANEHNERLIAEATEKLKALEDLERRERELAKRASDIEAKVVKIRQIRDDLSSYQAEFAEGRP